jgi:ATP-binding cassette, subfamily C, bacterial CydD
LVQPTVARLALAGSVLLGLVSTGTVVVQALSLSALISSAMPREGPPIDRRAALVWLSVAVGIRGLAWFGSEVLGQIAVCSVKASLRSKLLAAVLGDASKGAGRPPGEVATLAGRGLDALDVYIGRCLPDLVLAVLAPVALAVAIGLLDWPSGLVVAVAIGLFPVFGALVGRSSASLAARRWSRLEALGRQIADVFGGLLTLKAFGRSAEQRARIEAASEALRQASVKTLHVAFLSALVLDTLASVSVALVAVPLGLRLLSGHLPLGAALAVLIVAPEVFVPLRRASSELHQSTEGLAAVMNATELIDAARQEARQPLPRSTTPGDPAHCDVALRSVTVEVAGREMPLLRDANLVIHPGETVVLMGANGTGKSTVLSLLLGFLRPVAGLVTIGGVDLRTIDLEKWRSRTSYLPEHPTLITGTLADNLRLANPSASDEDLHQALAAVGAASLSHRLHEGVDRTLGAAGRTVSAGERQKIALARILLRPASLYLLDEPTAHLDRQSEVEVLAALSLALKGRSGLIVTHQPALTQIGDRVVTLHQGRFVPASTGQPPHAPGGTTDRPYRASTAKVKIGSRPLPAFEVDPA